MTTFTYSNYLSLTNSVLEELNEVPLNSSTFSSAVGFQTVAQNAVNKAIRDIQNQQWEWPYNHTYTSQILTPGVPIYALPANAKSVDWDTFFVYRNDALASPQRQKSLPLISYDDYMQKYQPDDAQQDSSQWAPPKAMFGTAALEFGVTPYPDQAYQIGFEYWKSYSLLAAYSDNSPVPDQFDYVVIDGAMYYCYRFRENLEAATEAKANFEKGIANMRNIYVPDYIAVTDKRVGPQFNTRI